MGTCCHLPSPMEALYDFAMVQRYLGIDPITDGDLMWIADEACIVHAPVYTNVRLELRNLPLVKQFLHMLANVRMPSGTRRTAPF